MAKSENSGWKQFVGVIGVLAISWGLILWLVRFFTDRLPLVVPVGMILVGIAMFSFSMMDYVWQKFISGELKGKKKVSRVPVKMGLYTFACGTSIAIAADFFLSLGPVIWLLLALSVFISMGNYWLAKKEVKLRYFI